MKTNSCSFVARVWFYDESLMQVETWQEGLQEMVHAYSNADWALDHITGCYSSEQLREILGIPLIGDYQSYFKGTIEGHTDSYSQEYDETMEVSDIQFVAVPEEFAKGTFYFTEEN